MGNTGNTRDSVERSPDILFPVMLIAAIAVIVFSFAGIAAMMGWLPGAQSQGRPLERNGPPAQRSAACVNDCGVVESIRAVGVKGEGSGLGAAGGAGLRRKQEP
jgi:hypothetical protein